MKLCCIYLYFVPTKKEEKKGPNWESETVIQRGQIIQQSKDRRDKDEHNHIELKIQHYEHHNHSEVAQVPQVG